MDNNVGDNGRLAIAGRILIGAFYVVMGLGLIKDYGAVSVLMTLKHLPEPAILLAVTIGVWFLGGAALITGIRRRKAAMMLLVVTAIVTIAIHNFWTADATHFPNEFQHFLKNVAICGALLGLTSRQVNDAASRTV